MGSEVIIMPLFFISVFGIFYLLISSRHKERMSLIEKGVDASIFYPKDRPQKGLFPVMVLNLGLLLFCIGLAVFIGGILHQATGLQEDIAYTGSILTLAGVGLFAGYRLTLKYYEQIK